MISKVTNKQNLRRIQRHKKRILKRRVRRIATLIIILCVTYLTTGIIKCFLPNHKNVNTPKEVVKITEKPVSSKEKPSQPQETAEVKQVPQKQNFTNKKVYTTSSVNLRSRPTADSESITVLSPYEIVVAHIENEDDEWYFVSCDDTDGNSGYVKSEYLKEYRTNSYVDIPLEYYNQDLVRDLIDLYDLDIDEYFIYGMMYCENRFSSKEESAAGAQGILQIMPSTWKFLYKDFCKNYPKYSGTIVNDPTDKRSNITLGIYCLKHIKDSYGLDSLSQNSSKILTTYNRGEGGANLYYKKYGTYSSSYSKEILRAAEYIRLYNTWKEGM